MNEWKRAKADYDSTPIPEELHARVQMGMAQAEKNQRRTLRSWKPLRIVARAAACLPALFVVLNASPAIAQAAGNLPVVGPFFRVLTIKSWHETRKDASIDVEVPYVESKNDSTDQINKEIQARVNEKVAEGNQIIEEYKEAFFETGGTQQDWDAHENKVTVAYLVKSQTQTMVSFVVISDVSIADAYHEEFYYNLDANGKELTLYDLLGDGWIEKCNQSIEKQIQEYPIKPGETSPFFGADMGGFSTVDETTQFYINEKGNPVVVFPRASIAIGAMGTVEFEIVK